MRPHAAATARSPRPGPHLKQIVVRGATLEEALDKVKRRVGPDAVLVDAEERPKADGTLSWRLVAHAGPETPSGARPSDPRTPRPAALTAAEPATRAAAGPAPAPAPPLAVTAPTRWPGAARPIAATAAAPTDALALEVAALARQTRLALEHLRGDMARFGRRLDAQLTAPDPGALAPLATDAGPLQDVQRWLVSRGADPRIAHELAGRAMARAAPAEGLALAREPDVVAEVVALLRTAPPLWRQSTPLDGCAGPTVALFMGPPGPGRRTAAAKVAAATALGQNRPVALVAAGERPHDGLVRLEKELELPVIPAPDAVSLRRTLTRPEWARAVIVVDTPNRAELGLLGTFVAAAEAACAGWDGRRDARGAGPRPRVQRHLVVSATTRMDLLAATDARYGALEPDALTVTDLAAAGGVGGALAPARALSPPITHLVDADLGDSALGAAAQSAPTPRQSVYGADADTMVAALFGADPTTGAESR